MKTITEQPPVLVLVCKRPALHQGKQRLAATLGAGTALALAERFLDCALEDAGDWHGEIVISPAHGADSQWAANLLPGCRVVPQPAGNLGQRLNAIDLELRSAGMRKLLFIGSDAPALTLGHYHQAIEALGYRDIVLSPAADGGVTMMGNTVPWPDLSGLPWSSAALGQALVDLCRLQGLDVRRIAPCYDIDRQSDLPALCRDLQGDPRPARQRLYRQLLALEQDALATF